MIESMSMFRKVLILLLCLSLSACGYPAKKTSLTVFAAASLTEAFGEIATAFEAAYPDTKVMLNLAGSNTLRAQIEQGAQADVFASANTREMDALVTSGLVTQDDSRIFLTNRLVAIAPADNPAGIASIHDLADRKSVV